MSLLPSSLLPPVTSHFHHARPLLSFMSSDAPSLWQLLASRSARLKAAERSVSPPPLVRRLLRRFPALLPSFQRKQSRLAERVRLADTMLQSLAVLPVALLVAPLAHSGLPSLTLPSLPLLSPAAAAAARGAGGGFRFSCAVSLLVAYVAALTACDTQLAVRQRATDEAANGPRTASAQANPGAAEEQEEDSDSSGSGSDSDSDSGDGTEEEEDEEEEQEDGDGATVDEAAGHEAGQLGGHGGQQWRLRVPQRQRRRAVDADIALQRRMLRSAEAAMRAQAATNDAPAAPRSDNAALRRSTAASALAHARSALKREDGSSLLVRLLSAALSAVRSELLYRHVMIAAVYASLAALSALLRRVTLLEGVRLLVDGLIPFIPLLAIAHSVLNEMDATPAALSRLMEQLHHPRVIVLLRLIGLAATLAVNGALHRPSLLTLYDRVLMPLMDALTLRCLRLPAWSTTGSPLSSATWTAPFAILSSLPTPPPRLPQPSAGPMLSRTSAQHSQTSFLRLVALSLFVSHLLSSDDSRCLDASRRTQQQQLQQQRPRDDVGFGTVSSSSGVSLSVSAALHRWLLSLALLRIRLTGGLWCSTAVHALLNCTAVLTRQLALGGLTCQ